jgi:outer membrane protein assembly factor BamB
MKYHIITAGCTLIVIGLLSSRCSKEHLDDVPKVIWRTPITVKKTFGTFVPALVGNKIVISVDSIGNALSTPVFTFDKNTGQLSNKWTDFFEIDKDIIESGSLTHQNENLISFATRTKIFTLEPRTGKTILKKWDNTYSSVLKDVMGIGDKIYRLLGNGIYDTGSEDYIKEYNTATGEARILYTAKGKDNYTVGLRYPVFYVDKNSDTILLVANMMYNFFTKQDKPFFIKYNITKQTTVFEKEWTHGEGGNFSASPLIKDGKVYVTLGRKIICIDLETGEWVWTRYLSAVVMFSDPIIAQNTFYVIDEERQLYALDLNTGNILWQTEGSGSSSNLAYLNGVLYFTGGGDGLLHAVEASNGQHLYKFRCPDEAVNSNFWWQRGVTVDPATKRLYVASYGSLFCLEAVR